MKGYSFDFRKYKEEQIAKAKIESIDVSWKEACAVCDAIRNKGVKEALLLLERVENMETPIPFRRHNKKMAHRRELGGKKGRWPVKAAKIIRKLVKSLSANALNKGLSEESLIIIHASANKKMSYPKLQPVGRRIRQHYETARIELVALDTDYNEEKVKAKELEKKKKEEAKKIEEEVKKDIQKTAKAEKTEKEEKKKTEAKEKVKNNGRKDKEEKDGKKKGEKEVKSLKKEKVEKPKKSKAKKEGE